MKKIDYFDIAEQYATQLNTYDPSQTNLRDFGYLITAATNAMQCTLPFFDSKDVHPCYQVWFDAMNRNFGDPDWETPFNGILLDMNDGYVKQVEDQRQVIVDNPGDPEPKLDMSVLLKDPMAVYAGINMCEWVSLNMETTKGFPDKLIPDRVPMEQAMTLQQLYHKMSFKVGDILKELPSEDLAYVKNVYIDAGEKEIPYTIFQWWLPNARRNLITQKMQNKEEN